MGLRDFGSSALSGFSEIVDNAVETIQAGWTISVVRALIETGLTISRGLLGPRLTGPGTLLRCFLVSLSDRKAWEARMAWSYAQKRKSRFQISPRVP